MNICWLLLFPVASHWAKAVLQGNCKAAPHDKQADRAENVYGPSMHDFVVSHMNQAVQSPQTDIDPCKGKLKLGYLARNEEYQANYVEQNRCFEQVAEILGSGNIF